MKSTGIQLVDATDLGEMMDLKIDVVRDASGKITQGISIGNTLNQNKALIIMANPGEFHFEPLLGAAYEELLLDDDYLRMQHRISEELQRDGLKIKNISLVEGKPKIIEADYV
ncbi:MAG: hypothetical protein GZ087_03410 [Flavobacterium sp.]|nr:hypothetical protein [Flavobacterium sp.]